MDEQEQHNEVNEEQPVDFTQDEQRVDQTELTPMTSQPSHTKLIIGIVVAVVVLVHAVVGISYVKP